VRDHEGCPFRLDGKVAVVTGASRNVGLAIARTFAAAGAGVVIAARDADRMLAAGGGTALFVNGGRLW
jgi:NAD(P)-dependent dehydrogenase (short-subunit alcohol dehydrogenase family)